MSFIRFLFVTVLFAFCGAITLSAKLRYDAEQGVFYSENAPRNVDQDEYDDVRHGRPYSRLRSGAPSLGDAAWRAT